PVRLSVPVKRARRWLPGRRGMAAPQKRDVQRIVTFLRGMLPTGSHPGALAIVPVDETQVAALSVVALARALAQHDTRVVVADLCSGAPAAKLVGLKQPGVHAVQADGAQIEVAIPGPDEFAPVGPFHPSVPEAEDTFTAQVAAAYAPAQVL